MRTSTWVLIASTFLAIHIPASLAAEALELYKPIDAGITILTVANFNSTIFNVKTPKQSASENLIWFIQFYNTWCGHCQHFAPSWKALSNTTLSWKSSVRLAVVDCSKKENSPVCNQYSVSSYPTLKFLPPRVMSGENITLYSGPHTEAGVLSGLVDYMDKIKFPEELAPVCEKSVVDLWKTVPGDVDHVILLVEPDDSKIGRDVVLTVRGHTFAPGLTLRRATLLNSEFLASLGEDVSESVARLWLLRRAGERMKIDLSGKDSLVSVFIESIFAVDDKICHEKGLAKPARQEIAYLKPAPPTDSRSSEDGKKGPKTPGKSADASVLSSDMADLISALVYMFPMEIGTHKTIEGAELQALQKFIPAMTKLIPFPAQVLIPLQKLSEVLQKASSSSITSLKILMVLKDNGFDTEVFPLTWRGCKGSVPGRRGYPCSLWQLFHTMTVFALEKEAGVNGKPIVSGNALDPHTGVLTAIFGYIRHFFSCQECRDNFIITADGLIGQTEKLSNRDAVLWLWRTHNSVNQRLAGDITEDDGHPKVQFPYYEQCPTCQLRSIGRWREDVVVEFLRGFYGLKEKTGFNVRDSKHRQMAGVHDDPQGQVSSGAGELQPPWSTGLGYVAGLGFLGGAFAGYRQLQRWRRNPVRWNFTYSKARVKWL